MSWSIVRASSELDTTFRENKGWYNHFCLSPAKRRLSLQMSTIHESKEMLANMTRAEKAQLLQWLVSDLGEAFPGIETRPGVSGGVPCIVRTRIPVCLLAHARRLTKRESALHSL